MADMVWTAPINHRDKGRNGRNVAGKDLRATGVGSSMSLHSINQTDQQEGFHSYQNLGHDNKGKYQKPPMSAVKGAWQQDGSRPTSAHSGNVDDDHEAAKAILDSMRAKRKGSFFQENLSGNILGPAGHRNKLSGMQVKDAGSVNKNREGKIGQLQGSFNQGRNSQSAQGTNAEFVAFAQTKPTYGDSRSIDRRSSQRGSIIGSNRPSFLHMDQSHHNSQCPHYNANHLNEDDEHEYVIEDLEKDDNGNFKENTYAEGADNDGGLPMIVVDDGEGKKGKRGNGGQSEMGGQGGLGGHGGMGRGQGEMGGHGGMSRIKKTEDLIEDRNRKLWQRMKKLNTFRSLFDKARHEATKAAYGFGGFNNTEDLSGGTKAESVFPIGLQSDDSQRRSKVPNTTIQGASQTSNDRRGGRSKVSGQTNEQDTGQTLNDLQGRSKGPSHANEQDIGQTVNDSDRRSKVSSNTSVQGHGQVLNNFQRKSRVPSYANVHDTGQLMMSPESIKVMRDTLDQKRQQSYGEQPWLLGRLALSKDTCRFEIPMDVYVLTRITPMEYLSKYAIISRRRKSLYRSVFVKTDKDRDGWISYRDLVKALKDIHVNYIDENEIDKLTRMLDLSDTPDQKFNNTMFSGIAAFSERLVLNTKQLSSKRGPFTKEKLEDADFDNLKWKLKDVKVNPAVMRVLEVL